jgi:DNA-binding LacI/PurR family transcriptional regulator
MADVARQAGVSAQTVSRVANGYEGVVEDTRNAVLRAMSDLGYRPNSAARALKRGEFRAIGVVLFTLATTGNMRTLEAITTSAADAGYAITLIAGTPTRGGIRSAFTRLDELMVDAVIVVMESHLLDSGGITLPPGAKVVVVDSDAGDRFAVVDTDQVDGARIAVSHLLDQGHETVWHVAGPDESFSAERRARAWRHTLETAGRTPPPVLRGDWSAESGYRAGLRLAADPTCTAVFCANDQMALGVYRALSESGLRVPHDISVVGFDDVAEASSFAPPLTTVHQDFAEMGRRSVARVLEQLRSGVTEVGTTLVPTHLVVRGSTAPPPPTGRRNDRAPAATDVHA